MNLYRNPSRANRRQSVTGQLVSPHLRWARFGAALLLVTALTAAWVIARSSPVLAAPTAPNAGLPAGLSVLSSSGDTLLLQSMAPTYTATTVSGPDGQNYTRLSIPGTADGESDSAPDAAGRPGLPRFSALLAVPPGATFEVSTQVLAETTDHLQAPVYPVPARQVAGPVDPRTGSVDPARATGLKDEFARDASAYEAGTPQPGMLAVVEDAGYVRDQHLARVTVYPLQYTPATGELRHIEQMRIEIHLKGAAVTPSDTATRHSDAGHFDEVLRQIILNPEQAGGWRADPPAPVFAPAVLPLDQIRYRITLHDTGVYQLTYSDLQAAGIPVAKINPNFYQVYQGNQELAIEVIGGADGHLDPGDLIRFYAQQVKSFYTDTNTLWLVTGNTPGRRMANRDVTPTGSSAGTSFADTEHIEQDVIYRSNLPIASDVDHWYWGQTYAISRGSVLTLTVPFTISNPLPSGSATLHFDLWGASADYRVSPDHHSRIYINGTFVGDVSWNGAIEYKPVVSFDQSVLRAGGNTLTIYTPGDTGARDLNNQPWEITWLNYFDLTYRAALQAQADHLAFTPAAGPGEFLLSGFSSSNALLYDVTDPMSPVRLAGVTGTQSGGAYSWRMRDSVPANGSYYAVTRNGVFRPLSFSTVMPSDLHRPATGADYLMIAPAEFRAGAERLAEFRRSQGLRVTVVDVQDIYDEFSGGLLDPHAIRDFIQYAYFNWPGPAPSYVLLVGTGTYDFMNHEGYGFRNFVPPFLAAVDPVLGETAADNRYVTVAGNDIMPDLNLGRFPVTNETELDTMVDKTIAYERTPEPGAWRTRTVFVADNADTAGDFPTLSDSAAAYVPSEFQVQRIYLGSPEYPTNYAVRAQQAILDAFNQGALLFNYVGHSAISNWSGEFLFGVSALPQVHNGSYYPIVLAMTCLEGSYQNPRFPSLGESVVRLVGRGALASWSPTGFGVASGHDYLHQGFYEALFEHDVRILGPATTAGKLNLYINGRFADGKPRFDDLLDTYVLFGDPATVIGVPDAQLAVTASGPKGQLMQGDGVAYTIHYSNNGPAVVHGAVLTATLPGGLDGITWSSSPSMTLHAGSRLTWDLPVLAPGASGVVSVTGTISWGITAADLPFSAEAAIASPWQESNYTDNRAGPITASLAPADLRVKQAVEPATSLSPGQLITFTVNYMNLGPGAAGGISVTLPLPMALDDVHIDQSGPSLTPRSGSRYAWDVAPMLPGDIGRITVSGRILASGPPQDASWSVASQILTNWVDPDTSNNVSEAATITVMAADSAEPDNTQAQARRVSVPMLARSYSYYPVGDQDWSVFKSEAGMTYLIQATSFGQAGTAALALWNGAGKLIAKDDGSVFGLRTSQIVWTAPDQRDYYVMATSYTASRGFGYELQIQPLRYHVRLPIVVSKR